jgi:hypothetical protein
MDIEDMDYHDVMSLARERLDSDDIKELFYDYYEDEDILDDMDDLTIMDYISKNFDNIDYLLDLVVDLFEKHKLDIFEKEKFVSRIKDYL